MLLQFLSISCMIAAAFCNLQPPGVNPSIYQQNQPPVQQQQPQQQFQQQQPQQQFQQQPQQQFQQQQPQQQFQQQPPQQQFQQQPQQQQQFQQQPQQQQQFQQQPQQQQQFQQQNNNAMNNQAQHQSGVPQQHFESSPQHGQVLKDRRQIVEEKDHIGEHAGAGVDTSKMNEQELQYHYFKMHDGDNNNKLDGLELSASLHHYHDEANHEGQSGHDIPAPKVFTDQEIFQLIDPIMAQDDSNGDGYVDYTEFVIAQNRAMEQAS